MVVFNDTEETKRIDFLRKREEEELAQMLAGKYGVEYVDLSLVAVNTDALRLLTEDEAHDAEIVAFGRVGKRVTVAARSPENPKAKAMIQKLKDLGYEVTVFITSSESLKRAFTRYADLSYATESKAGVFELSNQELEDLLSKVKGLSDISALVKDAIDLKRAYRITRILEVILAGGLSTNASDVHFEPEEAAVRLRYRLDGVLVDVLTFDHETYKQVLSRLKLLSGLKLNVADEAQDGRFSIKIKGAEIELRTSVLPGNYAETMVLRILNPKSIGVPLEELGLEPELRARIEREITKPNGMILNTGPTGSGKTTTLYAFLRKVNSPGSKIITIEDPIEYHLQGVVQTQVDKKTYTFAAGLRSALRQDPDIIMIGEIRDEEVASTAINAALTGHLVFSTLHTNDAAGTFPRLIDLGISEKVLSSSVNVAMAQRLVRKLCAQCRKTRPATPGEQQIIDRVLADLTNKALLPPQTGTIYDASPEGCPECHGSGYKGRIGIFEAIFMDRAIEEILRSKPSEREVAEAAKPQGIPTLQQDGILKVLRGVTSLDELRRVIDIDSVN
ncbi:MAG TPA: type II/IV secretion system protein [Candidatus Paceibacterota bacterium]|nr:type II/IV secretion system protein [Candidatus Paceibacterota bacterium]